MCIFQKLFAVEWFGECSKTVGTCGPFLAGVVQMYCIALQSRWHSVSTAVGVSSRKLPKTEFLYTLGSILHTLLMKLLLCLTVSCIVVIRYSVLCVRTEFVYMLPLKIIWNTVSGFCCHSWCGFYSVNSSVTLMNCSNTCKEKYPSKQLFSSLLDLVCTQDTFIVCKDSSSVFMLSGCFCGLLPCPFPKGYWWHTSFGGMQISE